VEGEIESDVLDEYGGIFEERGERRQLSFFSEIQ
jgi:hypothetical protein